MLGSAELLRAWVLGTLAGLARTQAWAPQRSQRSMTVSAPARPSSGISLCCSRSRPLAQNLLPLETITFFGP